MARKPNGRVTPKKGSPAAAGRPAKPEKWELDESRHVTTGWVWRAFMVLSLLGVGVALIMDGNHHRVLALLWLVIAIGWFGASMFLWRRHSRWMRGG